MIFGIVCTIIVLGCLIFANWHTNKKLDRYLSFFSEVEKHNERHVDITERQLANEEFQLRLGKETVDGMGDLSAALGKVATHLIDVQFDIRMIKGKLKIPDPVEGFNNPVPPEDFALVETLEHEIEVVDKDGADKV